MKVFVSALIYLISILFTLNVYAAGKSAKKLQADVNPMRAPQVLEPGDNLIGVRGSQGNVFDHTPAIGASYEHMITPNFAFGTSLNYASYSSTVRVGPYSGTYDYKAYSVNAFGAFHFDLFKAKNLDTSVSAGLGHTFIRSNWSSNAGLQASGDVDGDVTYLLGYANARYFINSSWAFAGSVGIGLGNVAIGMDYLF